MGAGAFRAPSDVQYYVSEHTELALIADVQYYVSELVRLNMEETPLNLFRLACSLRSQGCQAFLGTSLAKLVVTSSGF